MPRLQTFIARVIAPVFLLTSAAPPLSAAQNARPEPNPDIMSLIIKGREASAAYRFSEALRLYNEALNKSRALNDKFGEANTLNDIGAVYSDIGQPQKALEFYQQALPLLREVENKSGEAVTLSSIAAVEESQGRLAAANSNLLAALAILEDIRMSLGGLSEAKVSFLEANVFLYHAYVRLLLRQNNPADALTWTQKGKARSLLDLLQNGRVDLSRGLSDDEKREEGELQWRARQLNDELITEASRENRDAERLDVLRRQLAAVESDWHTFLDRLYVRRPNVALNRAAETATLADIARFLPEDTVLLEYTVLGVRQGNKAIVNKTVLFCVTVENGKPVVTPYTINQTREQLTERVGDYQAACADPTKGYETKARDLYDLLLAPAQKQLAGKKRLILCPDGPLWGLPFHALMTTDPKTGNRQFVAERYEVTYAYSATAVDAALRKKDDPQRPKPTGNLLVLANPDFGE